jgi:uncharacterized membrane protein YhaH (DUF805 family)
MPAFLSYLLSFRGRLNRARYLAIGAGVGLMYTFVTILLMGLDGQVSFAALLPIIVGWGASVWIQGAATVRRFHDLDRPGLHYWLLYIPFYNLYLAFVLLLQRGTEGSNRYGRDSLGSGPFAHHGRESDGRSARTTATVLAVEDWNCPRCGNRNSVPTCVRCGAASLETLRQRRAA